MTHIYTISAVFCLSLAWLYGFKREVFLLFGILVAPMVWGIATAETKAAWELLHEKLHKEQEAFSEILDRAFPLLREWAQKENQELAKKLLPPPRLRTGYQILPHLIAQTPGGTPPPLTEQRYDLTTIEPSFRDDFARAKTFAENTQHHKGDLAPLIDTYLSLRERLSLLAAHLSYHAQWQPAALQWKEFFAEKNSLIKKIREVGKDSPKLTALLAAADVKNQLAPFTKNPQLKIIPHEKSAGVIPVHFLTDIVDTAFLQELKSSIETGFNLSPAAKNKQLSVAVAFTQIPVAKLYPPPAYPPLPGASLDIPSHLAMFPKGSSLLTAAGDSTHAFVGQSLILAAGELSPRVLLHEFFHVLGFSDAYIRGFEGKATDPGGLVFVEFTGLYGDLMGFPGGGEISDEMIATLIKEYK